MWHVPTPTWFLKDAIREMRNINEALDDQSYFPGLGALRQ
ncbi:hypothetical protein SNOG_15807 [Parastagonospora nodorum SN15]|uniref:Uncharacterized protein n=1 Tax=Phaeosphaeria nodorum (strain SN15 / ATCC MYA-4574 / FGSC 10173) TaxID=321614 RepID=Q0TXP2_PHANO|nr:hypothetical protein SNOG_15807 [Parastagonospora nodorum SN15]EAT76902.1 hypothetical protein SNOG_15807 [Parastagonospora nodorum SN15]